jgi:glycosyltransferase involved in cell wall biosynthesis
MQAAAKIKEPFEIHLRGSFHTEAYKNLLYALVKNLNLSEKVFFHGPILAEHLIRDAVKYDVGLALESDVSENRNICVTNKIFSYLMSGLAIVGTATYGQKDVFSHFKESVVTCRMNDADDLAMAMRFYIQHPRQLAQAKRAAGRAAEGRYNWELESRKLINLLEETVK